MDKEFRAWAVTANAPRFSRVSPVGFLRKKGMA